MCSFHLLPVVCSNLCAQADRDVPVIRLDYDNTVRSVRDQLVALVDSGYEDGVIPVLRKADDEDNVRLVGVIGASELEHALSECDSACTFRSILTYTSGIVADEADSPIYFYAEKGHPFGESSTSSLFETSSHVGQDPFDLGVYLNQVSSSHRPHAPWRDLHACRLGAFDCVQPRSTRAGTPILQQAWCEIRSHH